MDPISIATMAIGLANVSWTAAKNLGLVGNPDWVKYADAGLYIATQATKIIRERQTNPKKYDDMTPEQIRALLVPATWDEIEARAAAELGIQRPDPS